MKKIISGVSPLKPKTLPFGHVGFPILDERNPIFDLATTLAEGRRFIDLINWIKNEINSVAGQILSSPQSNGIHPTTHLSRHTHHLFLALQPLFTWLNKDQGSFVRTRGPNPVYKPNIPTDQISDDLKGLYEYLISNLQAPKCPRPTKTELAKTCRELLIQWLNTDQNILKFLKILCLDFGAIINAAATTKPGPKVPEVIGYRLVQLISQWCGFVILYPNKHDGELSQVATLNSVSDIDSCILVVVRPNKTIEVFEALREHESFCALSRSDQSDLLSNRASRVIELINVIKSKQADEGTRVRALTQLYIHFDFIFGIIGQLTPYSDLMLELQTYLKEIALSVSKRETIDSKSPKFPVAKASDPVSSAYSALRTIHSHLRSQPGSLSPIVE